MDYVYDPQVAADITEYVQYISPVDGVKEILVDRDPEIAKNQLIFPDRTVHRRTARSRSAGGRSGGDRGIRVGIAG